MNSSDVSPTLKNSNGLEPNNSNKNTTKRDHIPQPDGWTEYRPFAYVHGTTHIMCISRWAAGMCVQKEIRIHVWCIPFWHGVPQVVCELKKKFKAKGKKKKTNFAECSWQTLGKKLDAVCCINILGEYIIDAECLDKYTRRIAYSPSVFVSTLGEKPIHRVPDGKHSASSLALGIFGISCSDIYDIYI
jgi:hypothetical protein